MFGGQNFDNEHNKTVQEVQNYLKNRKNFSQNSSPNNIIDLFVKAQKTEQNKDYQTAVYYYDKMIEIDPKNPHNTPDTIQTRDPL